MKANISKLFYKKYFDEFCDGKNPLEVIDYNYLFEKNEDRKKSLSDTNKKILIKRNKQIIEKVDFVPIENVCSNERHSILVTIQYPGLITGVGINHEAKIEGEFKLGVHFDYTWGMPVIYGSSVKGVLRSAFKRGKDYNKEYILKLEDENKKKILSGNVDVEDLFMDIFEGKIRNEQKDKNENGKLIKGYDNKSIYNRDIFFDAVIIAKNSKNKILDSDSITPHTKGPLKNPIPITFLKIASGVTMEFRFDLKDYKIDGKVIVSADKKKQLFKQILLDFGIGAKTNVGYGQFKDISN